ncbi:MAG: efflux RND transporter periplasmic adaptor subunit [Candidatus Sericytochromatia bacterium]|nr:efflux RND transporter periplasmic adaptor subunit [Candidatus Sericytochromatia bacterium]
MRHIRRTGWLRLSLAGLLGIMAVGACSQSRGGSGGGSDKAAGAAGTNRQQTVVTALQTIRPVLTTSGKVVPRQVVNLSPKTSGRLVALYVDQGARVRKGDLVAKMDDQEVRAQVAQSRANLTQAQARLALMRAGNRPEEIAQSRAQLDGATARMQQSTMLQQANEQLLSKGYISGDEALATRTIQRSNTALLQEAQTRYDLIRRGNRPEDIAQAQAQVDGAAADLQIVQLRLNETEIRAPFDGMITQKYASVGAFVTPTTSASGSSSATSTSIVALVGALEVLAKVPEVDIIQLRADQFAEIISDAFPGTPFKGHVRLIAPEAVIEQNVTAFEVRISLDDGLATLRSGMSVDARFAGTPIPNALVVPSVSITTKDKQLGVWVLNQTERKPEFKPVTVGPTTKDKTQVLSGLEAGERVYISQPQERTAAGFNPMRMLGIGGGGGRRP